MSSSTPCRTGDRADDRTVLSPGARLVGRVVSSPRARVVRSADPLVRYGLPALAGVVMPLLWFRPGRYFASGDVAPFLRQSLASELGSVWGHQISGAGGPSYEVARLPDILLTRLCGLFGLGAPAAQVLLYALILGGAAVGTSHLASCWLRRPSAAACAGVLSVVNVYQLVSLLNPLPALAGALTAVLAGRLLRAAQGHRIRAAPFALATLPLCYLGANPPLLALVAVGTLAVAAFAVPLTGGRIAPVLGLLLRAAPLAVGIQLWWLLPELITLHSGGGGAQFSAQTNVQAWAWTQTRNTLGNIVTLNSHWGWRYPEYYPFAPAMGRLPWSLLRWAPPLLALAGAVLPPGTARNRRALRGLAAAGAVLVLLCKGLHAPLAGVNAWLYQWIPGMWMFREPMSKFGVLLVLVVAILAGAAVERALDRVPARGSVCRTARWARVGAALVVTAAVAYPWPLWTGAVVTQARTPEFSASVAVPADWQRVADRANASPVQGKVLELPLQGYYQVLTTWGYHGADNVPQQLLTRPLLQRLPGGYFDAAPALSQLMSVAQQSLVDGRSEQALGALRALDVTQVIVRRDLIPDPGEPATADPRSIAAGLARVPGIRIGLTTSVAQLFQLADPPPPPALLTADRDADATAIAAAAGSGAATTDDPAVPVDQASFELTGPTRQQLNLLRGGDYTVSVRNRLGVGYLPVLRRRGSSVQAVLTPAEQTALDGTTLPTPAPIAIPLDPPADLPPGLTPSALLVDGRPVPWSGDSPVTVRPGQEVAVAVPSGTGGLVNSGNGAAGVDGGCSGSARNGSVTRLPGRGWQVDAVRNTACLRLPLASVPQSGLVSLALSYRTSSGIGPRLCLWQTGPESCALAQQLPAGTGWRPWSAVLRVAPGTKALALYGYADADPGGGGPGIADYRDVSATALAVVGRGRAPGTADVSRPWAATAGPHLVRSSRTGAQAGPAGAAAVPLGFTGLQDCGRVDNRGFGQAGLVLRPLAAGGIRLEARAHTACTSAVPASSPLQLDDRTGGTGEFHLTLRYRTMSGAPARLCLWQTGPNRCASVPAMVDSSRWTTLDARVTPQPGTTALALYLYADGEDAGTTAAEYDSVRLSPTPPPSRLTLTAAAPPATASLRVATSANGRFTVGLAGLDGSRLVALPDSYDSRWQLQGLPSGWSARPLQIDGYRQAWVVTGRGDAVLHAAFGPDLWWHRAVAASLLALLAAFLLLPPFRPSTRRTSPLSAAEPTELPEPPHARLPLQPAELPAELPAGLPDDLRGRSDTRPCTAGDPAARFAGGSGLHRGRGADQRRPPL